MTAPRHVADSSADSSSILGLGLGHNGIDSRDSSRCDYEASTRERPKNSPNRNVTLLEP